MRPHYPTSPADKAQGFLVHACSSRLTTRKYILRLLLPTSSQVQSSFSKPKERLEGHEKRLQGQADHCREEDRQGLEENGVWMLVVPLTESHVLYTKWVLKEKTDVDGAIENFKASLMECFHKKLTVVNTDRLLLR